MLLDLFPLNFVVFPHQKIWLRIFEPRYLKLIEMCYEKARSFGICLIREGEEVGAPAVPFKIGTSVVIKDFTNVSDNFFYIVALGERRFRIERFIQEQPHIKVEIGWLDNDIPSFPGNYTLLRNITADFLKDKSKIPEDNNELFGLVGTLLVTHSWEKQKILELPDEKVIPALTRLMESI